jgi:diguanylate cyclase (GGDEF)-like protein/PAS domain S-box-containing protein
MGLIPADHIHPHDQRKVAAAWDGLWRTGRLAPTEYRYRQSDGSYRWMSTAAQSTRDAEGKFAGWSGFVADVDDERRLLDTLQSREHILRLGIKATGLGIWEIELATMQENWWPEAKAMVGFAPDDVVDGLRFRSLIHPDDREKTVNIFERCIIERDETPWEICFRIRRADTGEERWVQEFGWLVIDELSGQMRMVGALGDITDKKLYEDKLAFAATHDGMTGLLNRDGFQAAVDSALLRSAEVGEGVTLFMLDLDKFKEINDSLGHDAGDAVLRATADRLRGQVGRDVPIGRLGGDEFAIVFPSADDVSVLPKAQDILERIVLPVRYKDTTVTVRASIGIATGTPDNLAADDLMKAADLALYRAKQEGHGGAVIFKPQMQYDLDDRLAISRGLRVALDTDQMEPYYQAKVDLKTGSIVGFEALARWNNPLKGIVSAAAFATALEDSELALLIDERIIDKALLDISSLLVEGIDPGRIAFNMSTASLTFPEASDRLISKLRKAGIPSSSIQIEVTESVLLDRKSHIVEGVLRRFRDAGITTALDDFGTGYASLTHLKRFPIDEIKIDKSFIRDLEIDEDDAAITSALISLGSTLGLAVVAEGVETRGQADLLRAWGCPIAQGYLFARPMPASALRSLLLAPPLVAYGVKTASFTHDEALSYRP